MLLSMLTVGVLLGLMYVNVMFIQEVSRGDSLQNQPFLVMQSFVLVVLAALMVFSQLRSCLP